MWEGSIQDGLEKDCFPRVLNFSELSRKKSVVKSCRINVLKNKSFPCTFCAKIKKKRRKKSNFCFNCRGESPYLHKCFTEMMSRNVNPTACHIQGKEDNFLFHYYHRHPGLTVTIAFSYGIFLQVSYFLNSVVLFLPWGTLTNAGKYTELVVVRTPDLRLNPQWKWGSSSGCWM